MRKLLTAIEHANPKRLFWFIVAAAIIIAARMQAIQHGWINPDSVLYLEAAKRIVIGDFQGAYSIFPWPFYALCIATVSKLTSFNVFLSAQLLNMVFFGMATASFLKIIQLGGGKNLTLFAGALLLFGNLYIVGDVLEMLMRDQGFWAFYLASLVFFIRFYQQNKISDALLWQIAAILAVLFRIEAITFLLFLPLIFVFDRHINDKQRMIKLIKSYLISLLMLLVIFLAITTIDSLSIKNFGRLEEVFNLNLWAVFSKNLMDKSSIMSTEVLGTYLEEYAIVGLLLTFAYVIFVKNITTLGLVGVVSVAMYFKNKFHPNINSEVKRVLAAVSIICVINMTLIITKVFVLSSRYVVALTFILLILAAFYLGHLFKEAKDKNQTRIILITSIAIIVMCLSIVKNVLPKQPGYNYMQQAIVWIKNHQHDSTIFYEDSRLRYYAKAPFIGSGVFDLKTVKHDGDNHHSYDYLVINFNQSDLNKKELLLQSLPEYKEIKRFYAVKNKKYCAIYQKQLMQ